VNIADRAAAILRDEIADGALANITRAKRVWSTDPGAIVASLARAYTRPAALPDTPRYETTSDEQVVVLQARRSVVPGASAKIETLLSNDRRRPIDVGFWCTDLLSASGARITPDRVRLEPASVRIPPAATAPLAILVDVPFDAAPGVYRGLLQAADLLDVQAIVSLSVVQERPGGGVV
jgi:hypothetical protein